MRKIKIVPFILFVFLCVIFVTAKESNDVYKSVNNDEMKIALSFDDGPHPVYTPEILSVLGKYKIKTTFFVIGENAKNHPELLQQINEEGHELGNHTFTHSLNKNISNKVLTYEITKSHKIIKDICGYDVKLFRPPGGIINNKVKDTVGGLGYKIILWNIDTRDWAHSSVESITKNVLSNIKSGSIVLFHDYIYKNSPTVEALEKIIPKLKDQGYTFVTVGELIELDRKTNAK